MSSRFAFIDAAPWVQFSENALEVACVNASISTDYVDDLDQAVSDVLCKLVDFDDNTHVSPAMIANSVRPFRDGYKSAISGVTSEYLRSIDGDDHEGFMYAIESLLADVSVCH